MAKNEPRKLSRREELAQDGVLEAAYTQKWFVKVREALAIGMVQFSFVLKGQAKDSHFDIYINYDKIRSWLKDFTDTRYAQRVLATEKANGEKYPAHYRYVTGENGSKTLGIANSTTDGAYVINGSVLGRDGKRVYANVPIAEPDSFFESLDFWLKVVDGRIDPAEGSYIADIRAIYWASAAEREKHFTKDIADTEEYPSSTEAPVPSESPVETAETPVAEAPAIEAETSAEPAPEPAKPEENEGKARIMNFLTDGEFFFVDTPAEVRKKAEDRITKVAARAYVSDQALEEEPSELIFYKTQRAKQQDWYDRLLAAAAEKSVRIKVKVKPCGEREGRKQFVFQSNES